MFRIFYIPIPTASFHFYSFLYTSSPFSLQTQTENACASSTRNIYVFMLMVPLACVHTFSLYHVHICRSMSKSAVPSTSNPTDTALVARIMNHPHTNLHDDGGILSAFLRARNAVDSYECVTAPGFVAFRTCGDMWFTIRVSLDILRVGGGGCGVFWCALVIADICGCIRGGRECRGGSLLMLSCAFVVCCVVHIVSCAVMPPRALRVPSVPRKRRGSCAVRVSNLVYIM